MPPASRLALPALFLAALASCAPAPPSAAPLTPAEKQRLIERYQREQLLRDSGMDHPGLIDCTTLDPSERLRARQRDERGSGAQVSDGRLCPPITTPPPGPR